jgi:IS5 family transposase
LQFENASSGCSIWQVAKRDNRERKKHLPNEINDAVKRKKSRNRMLRSLQRKNQFQNTRFDQVLGVKQSMDFLTDVVFGKLKCS